MKTNIYCPNCTSAFDNNYIVKVINEKNRYFCFFCKKDFLHTTKSIKQVVKTFNDNKQHKKQIDNWFDACKDYNLEVKSINTYFDTIKSIIVKSNSDFRNSNIVFKNNLKKKYPKKPIKSEFIK